MASKDSFTFASSGSKWYEGLKLGSGSCLDLYKLIHANRELIHKLGPNGKTVLHKGVHHGYGKLVKFILVDMFDENGNCICKFYKKEDTEEDIEENTEEDTEQCGLSREELLRKTDRHGDTAVHIGLVSGSPKMMKLLQWAIEVSKCEDSSPSDRDKPDDEGYSIPVVKQRTSNPGSAPEVDNDEVFIENSFAQIKYGSDHMNRAMYEEVYKIIAGELGKCGEWIEGVKERIERNVNVQFVPIEHIILHFLFSLGVKEWEWIEESGSVVYVQKKNPEYEKIENLVRSIIEECRKHVLNHDDWMVVTLLNILDPQGRTVLHAASASGKRNDIINGVFEILDSMSRNYDNPLSKETIHRCVNVTDGVGRTLCDMLIIHNLVGISPWKTWRRILRDVKEWKNHPCLDRDLLTKWLENSGFLTLHWWCFGNNPPVILKHLGFVFGSISPLHLSIIFDNQSIFNDLLGVVEPNEDLYFGRDKVCRVTPFKLASILGRTAMVEEFMKQHSKVKNVHDIGFGNISLSFYYSAIHCAAMLGQSDTVQMILRYPIYDPICQSDIYGTTLHALVGMGFHRELHEVLMAIKELALCYALPSSLEYEHIKKVFLLLDDIGNVPRMFTNNEKTCINLLIQGGIDVWTTNKYEDGQVFPSINENGNNEARAWWFEKVVKEVEIKKASITSAANATSVIGALVATASFIGPLQPPSSYGDGDYIQMGRKAIQVYLVCNNFSFFFSIASILMAVLPAIPMSKESLCDEMLRSDRCLKSAVAFLLVSIICIIASFTSASIAVVSPQWHERKFVVVSTSIGVVICLFVLVIHIIRLLRMVFHKNTWLRRKFARHMCF